MRLCNLFIVLALMLGAGASVSCAGGTEMPLEPAAHAARTGPDMADDCLGHKDAVEADACAQISCGVFVATLPRSDELPARGRVLFAGVSDDASVGLPTPADPPPPRTVSRR